MLATMRSVEGKMAPQWIAFRSGSRAAMPADRSGEMEQRRQSPEGGSMKRILFGLGCTLIIPGGLIAQDRSAAARLGLPTDSVIRAQAPDVRPAAGFDVPKPMPKGTVTESPAVPALPPPGPAPVPVGTPSPTLPPGATITGPVIVDPPGTPIPGGPIPGAPIPTGPMVNSPVYGDPFGGYPGIGGGYTHEEGGWYAGIEALAWWVKSYPVPSLVTSGPAFSGATLSTPGVSVLYGQNDVDTNPRYGARITLGKWLNPCWAVELSGFYVRPSEKAFNANSAAVAGDLARPFFDVNNNGESSEIVGRPGVVSGGVNVTARSSLWGGELNARRKWWNDGPNRLDLIGGLRYLYLDEDLTIVEDATGLAGAGALAGIHAQVQDVFQTRNQFYGAQVGGIFTHVHGDWTFELRAKIAAGITRQTITINGVTVPGDPNRAGGLLALPSNIGDTKRDVFSVVPEIGLNLGYDINQHCRIFVGASFMYWTNVARPGPQIDRALDINQIPGFPAAPPASQLRPIVPTQAQNVWVTGANVGFLFKW
jgi:hypothetical protein